MEVTTVSPSPASPTEGDDLCETDVTDVAIHSVTLLICLCGLAGNGAVIGLLRVKIRNRVFYVLAVTDFIFLLLFLFPSTLLFLVEDVSCSLVMPLLYLHFLSLFSDLSYYVGLFPLIACRNVQYMCKLCCHRDLPKRLRWVLECVQGCALSAVLIFIFIVLLLCRSNADKHCRAALISVYTIILLLIAAPLLISSTVDFIRAKWGSKQQQPKRRDVVIFVIALFIVLHTIWNLLQQLDYIIVPFQAVFLLPCINSSIKPFIYFLAGRCTRPCSVESLRLSLQRVFEEQKKKTARRNDATRDTVV